MRIILFIAFFCSFLIHPVPVFAQGDVNAVASEQTVAETTENAEEQSAENELPAIDGNTLDKDGNLLVRVYKEDKKWGLEKTDGTKLTQPIYKKLIRLGDKSWIVQYKTKYGLIDYNGDYIILPKYRNVERIANKYVKFGNDNDYGLYNEYGGTIIQPEYSSIDLLYGKMFLIRKNYRYGVVDMQGNTLLDTEFDDIYMPKPNVMLVQYQGNWSKIESVTDKEITLPEDLYKVSSSDTKDFTITNLVVDTGVGVSYSVVTATDYLLKAISLISPAYEATIDELMYSQGADTISILMKLSWLPKFPFTYVKNYYKLLRSPNNGPLANTRTKLKKQMR